MQISSHITCLIWANMFCLLATSCGLTWIPEGWPIPKELTTGPRLFPPPSRWIGIDTTVLLCEENMFGFCNGKLDAEAPKILFTYLKAGTSKGKTDASLATWNLGSSGGFTFSLDARNRKAKSHQNKAKRFAKQLASVVWASAVKTRLNCNQHASIQNYSESQICWHKVLLAMNFTK